MSTQHYFSKRNGLRIVFLSLMFITLAGQAYTDWNESNDERLQKNLSSRSFSEYLYSGHLIQVTFENWETVDLSVM